MKSITPCIISLAIACVLTACNGSSKTTSQSSEMTLTEALQQRHSVRSYTQQPVAQEDLMTLLWAACGINREDGKLTAPTAKNIQDVRAYVVKADGAWLYQPADSSLVQVSQQDLRAAVAGPQEFALEAPICIVLTSYQPNEPQLNEHFAYLDCGYASQNICLMCTALGLATVPRMMMDRDALAAGLHLADKETLVINHPIGYEKQ